MKSLSGAEVDQVVAPDAGAIDRADAEPQAARLKALQLEVQAAKRRARAASRSAIPDPVVGAGVQRAGGEGSDPAWGYFVGIEVPLPLFDHGQGDRAEAEATVDKLKVEHAELLATAEASLFEARERLAVNRARLDKQRAASERARNVLDIARKSYGLGGATLLTLIDAERSALNTHLRVAERMFDVHLAEADVAFLTGAYDEKETSSP